MGIPAKAGRSGRWAGREDVTLYRSSPYDRASLIADFDSIRISLASPEKIRSWSHGEVTKPETINYRTFKPERDGLFCAKIFGPVTDWECLCGKYKRMKHRGVICDKCGVEVTLCKVRRERLGHIELASPCSHVWFFKGLPSRIGYLLDISMRDLERILYFEGYVAIDIGDVPGIKEREMLPEEKYRELQKEYAGQFVAKMGAEAIKELLKRVEVEKLSEELREKMKVDPSLQKRIKYAKRLKVLESFRKSGNKPEWMILDVIPVLPPELRPLVPLDGGRFATSDLNDLYRRVINRNNRLKKLMELHAPDVIVRNEKRMLQEAVDALFDNGRRGRVLRGTNNRPLKSLSDTLKGKQGRFRQNLLGKRVDYSGRSVIVVGPELKLHQCGLPKKMALELFKPFIYHRLEAQGHCTTIKQAKEMVEQQDPIVWDILEEVIREHPVLLNRAPTLAPPGHPGVRAHAGRGQGHPHSPARLHRLQRGLRRRPDGRAHPALPGSAGRSLRAHAQLAATSFRRRTAYRSPFLRRTWCWASTTSPSPSPAPRARAAPSATVEEVLLALEAGEVELLTPIRLRYTGEAIDLTTAYDDQDVPHTEAHPAQPALHQHHRRPRDLQRPPAEGNALHQRPAQEKGRAAGGQYCYLRFGLERTVRMLDGLKDLGFLYATKAGISIGIDDMLIPGDKAKLVENAEKEVVKVQQQYLDGAITNGERYNKVIAIWGDVTERVADEMFKAMEQQDKEGVINPIYVMADSGARGSKQQIRQLSGMRGLMAKPSGEVIETPITSNFREGLTVLQYFISTHGARKGLADTALKTADSGYLTRRLVDVAQDVIINELDCGTADGIYVEPIVEAGVEVEPLRDRVVGRVSLEKIKDYEGNVIVDVNQEITEELANSIQAAGIERVQHPLRAHLRIPARRLRPLLRPQPGHRTHGRDGRSRRRHRRAVHRRARHAAHHAHLPHRRHGHARHRTIQSRSAATTASSNSSTCKSSKAAARHLISMNRSGLIAVVDEKGREKERYHVVYGARLRVADGQPVNVGQVLAEWDPLHLLHPDRSRRQRSVQGPAPRHHHRRAGGRSHRPVSVGCYPAARR